MTKQPSAIIIGAGAGGLATANILAKKGYAVSVYEKNDQVGGRMGLLKKDGFSFDTGPSWYLMADVFDHYFSLLGEKVSNHYKLKRLTPAYKVFYDYTDPIIITGKLEEDLATFERIEAGSSAQLSKYITRAETNYKLALRHFLYNPFRGSAGLINLNVIKKTPEFIRLFAQPLHSYVKRYFKTQVLQQILEYPMVFLGASPYSAPALYQLMSYLDFKEGVFYPEGGFYKITEALLNIGKKLGVKYFLNSPVENIIVKNGRATGVKINGKDVLADIVISNADLHFTETKLLPKSAQSYKSDYWIKRTAGPSALLLYFGVRGPIPELKHHNLFFVKDWRKNFDSIYKSKKWPEDASIYVCRPSASDNSVAPKVHENIFVLVPLPAGTTKSKSDTEKYVDKYLAQIESMSGVSDLRERIVTKEVRDPGHFGDTFNSWQYTALGMSHTLKQSAFLRPSVKSKKLDNLYYVGAGTQPGIGVPMCLISAELVYKSIIKNTSPGPLKDLGEAK